jgi:FeS assembly protein IscX
MEQTVMGTTLNWDATYEIARALRSIYPQAEFEEISLENIFEWTLGLPNFKDDPELANEDILLSIFQEWYEECNPL